MTEVRRKNLARKGIVAALVGLLVIGLAACAPTLNEQGPQREGEPAFDVRLPAPNENGIVTADMWEVVYPNEFATYMKNGENTDGKEVSEDYPEIKVLWEGTAYADYYHEPNGHTYALKDVAETPRDPQYASCLTCKSSEFIKAQDADVTLNKEPFDDVLATVSEPISCYDCHRNSPRDNDSMATRQFFIDSVGEDAEQLPVGAMACGQCHNEYFFPGENKAAENPWNGLAEATPDNILANHNAIGYVDHVNPRTGASMVKVQHPEFETMYGGTMSPMAQLGYSCSDCHMAPGTDENGLEYKSHTWVSPLANEQLLEDDCSQCHADITAEVADKQKKTVEREHAVGARITELIEKTEAAIAENKLNDEQLAKVRDLHRTAQFYWDFVMVENSEGAHNSALTTDCFNKADAAVDEALQILGT